MPNGWASLPRRATALALALIALALTGALAGPAAATPSCGSTGVFVDFGAVHACNYAVVGTDSFEVPPYQTSVTFDVFGAGGGRCNGYGGHSKGTLAVSSFDDFQINVGGKPTGINCENGGFNGGGAGGAGASSFDNSLPPGAGGAGASDVRVGAFRLLDRIFVGGGGGGRSDIAAHTDDDGAGGGASGNDGHDYRDAGGAPGGGGTQFAAGASPGNATSAGFGFGGGGGHAACTLGSCFARAGYGGGGGYMGGGGSPADGDQPGGAGGGSGYITPLATDRVSQKGGCVLPPGAIFKTCSHDGDGQVVVSWSGVPVTATVTVTADRPNPVPTAGLVNLTAHVTTSTGVTPVGFVILVSNGKYNLGSGFLDGDGNVTVTKLGSSLPVASNDVVAIFTDWYGVIPKTSSAGLDVERARFDQTVSFSSTAPSNPVVGGSYDVAASASSGLPVTFSIPSVSSAVCSVSGSTVSFIGVGTCKIDAFQAGNDTYNPGQARQELTVGWPDNPIPLTVTVFGTQTQGGSAHLLYTSGAPVSGTLDCDTVDSGTPIDTSLALGSHTVDGSSCTGLTPSDSDHYLVTYVGRHLGYVVTLPAINVTVTGSQTFGGTPTFDYTSDVPAGVTISGDVTCNKVGVNTLITSTLGPGTYNINGNGCSGLSASGGYVISYTGTFTVEKAWITVTVSGDQGYQGGPEFHWTDDAPMSIGDPVTCTGLTEDTPISTALDVGSYTIDGSTCSGYVAPFGYRVRYQGDPGGYLVNPVEVTVTVHGGHTYGQSPDLEYFDNSLGRVVVSGTLSCDRVMLDTPLDSTLPVGDYSVAGRSCHGLSLSDPKNFRLHYQGLAGGGYRVTPVTITVNASGSMVEGGTPDFSYTDDAPDGVTLSGSLTCTEILGSLDPLSSFPPGSYTLNAPSCSGLEPPDENYLLDYHGVVKGFVVTPAVVHVQVSGTQTYGGSAQFTKSDDAPGGVTVSGTLACTTVDSGTSIGPALAAGNHTVDGSSCSGLSASGGYDVEYSGVTDGFVVSQATVHVQVSGTQTFGGSAHFSQTNDAPGGAGLGGSPSCTTVGASTPIDSSLGGGSYTVLGSSCSGMTLVSPNYKISYAGVTNGYVVGPAATSILYSGQQLVMQGSSLTPKATLSSAAGACKSGMSVRFSLDVDPTTGTPGTYVLESATTSVGGDAVGAAINTTGWLEGQYAITASFAGTDSCSASSDEGSLAIASPGDSASGGGWYSLSGAGRTNFGFTIRKVPKTTSTYTGQLLVINNGKWRIKGTLTSYGLTGTSALTGTKAGSASGTGNLYWWNAALNGGLGGWQLAQSSVAFSISFSATSTGKKSSPGSFGIQISYKPVSPQPSTLPNSVAQLLKGGTVNVA